MDASRVSETAAPKLELGRVGDLVPRADGIPKVTGEFAYSSDLQAAGMLWGQTLRSPHAHARINAIDISPALAMPGVHAVLTHPDVQGEVSVSGVYEIGIQDQAFLGPESGLAVPDGVGGIDVYVATQWLHVDRDQVAPCLGLKPEQVRIHLA